MTQGPFDNLLRPGEPAPDFTLRTLNDDRRVSLSDYRGHSSLFLGLFVGLYCPFCRRAIAQMSSSAPKLRAHGIESLGVVATDPENARLYFKFRPTELPLAVDPDLTTHRSYRVPRPELTPELLETMAGVRINPTGELPGPMGMEEASQALNRLDGFVPTTSDGRDFERQFPQMKGQFLIDRDGLIQWSHIDCAKEGPAGFGKYPAYDEMLAAARAGAVR
jgi:peroxiredoxin